MTTQNPAPTCGGCEGKGAHSRACRSPIHTIADLVDNLGDTLSNHPNQANTAWNLAAQLRAIAAPAGVIDREAIARALHAVDAEHEFLGDDAQRWDDCNQGYYLRRADAVLAVLPARTVAQVKGEALREAATGFRDCDEWPYRASRPRATEEYLNARADELEREGKR